MLTLLSVLTLLTALGSALVAGTFFAFSSFVMPALAARPNAEGAAAMQAINVTVVRSPFIAVFLATTAASVLLAVAALAFGDGPWRLWLLAGALLYVGGTFLITILCNVPLNDALAAVKPDAPDAPAEWRRYVTAWTQWNHVRTAAALVATAAFTLALAAAP